MNRITKNVRKFSVPEMTKMLDNNTKRTVKAVFSWIEQGTEVVDKSGNIIEGAELRAKENGKDLQNYLDNENKK